MTDEKILRAFLAVILCVFVAQPTLADTFTGSWHWALCDKKNPRRDCGGLSLVLLQNANRVCGVHTAASLGLGQLDEGTTPSVSGAVRGNKAFVEIRSGRSGT